MIYLMLNDKTNIILTKRNIFLSISSTYTEIIPKNYLQMQCDISEQFKITSKWKRNSFPCSRKCYSPTILRTLNRIINYIREAKMTKSTNPYIVLVLYMCVVVVLLKIYTKRMRGWKSNVHIVVWMETNCWITFNGTYSWHCLIIIMNYKT